MKLYKKIIISSVVFFIILFCFNNISNADLTATQRKTLVQNVENFINQGNALNKLAYSQEGRLIGYNYCMGNKNSTTGAAGKVQIETVEYKEIKGFNGTQAIICKVRKAGALRKNCLFFDCSSFVSAMYDMTFGKGTVSVQTTSTMGQKFSTISKSDLQPGDILNKAGSHVVMYLGTDGSGKWKIAEAHSFGTINWKTKLNQYLAANPRTTAGTKINLAADKIYSKQVEIRHIASTQYASYKAMRLKTNPSKCNSVDPFNGVTIQGSSDGATGGDISGAATTDFSILGAGTGSYAYWPKNYSTEDELLTNSDGFFHKGMAAYGGYSSFVTVYSWFMDVVTDFSSWLFSLVVGALKSVVLGWVEILENLVSSIITCGNSPNGLSAISIDSQETTRASVEDIIYNKIPLFDVNVFDFVKAGGQTLVNGGLIYTLRTIVAGFYYAIRNISIMLMLVMLLGTAVKLAFSSAAGEKAVAKEEFKRWVVGFIIIMSIHYIMIGIIAINQKGIEVVKAATTKQTATTQIAPTTTTLSTGEKVTAITNKPSTLEATELNEETLYEQIRILAYDMSPLTGFAGAVLYIILIFYLILFAVLYTKRLFVVLMLIIIAPLMGVMYALNFVKNTFKLNVWLKEFAYNVLIQFIHVIVYSVIVGTSIALLKAGTILSAVFACVALGILLKAEYIVRDIFGFTSKTLGGFNENKLGFVATAYSVNKIIGMLKEASREESKKANSKNGSNKIKLSKSVANIQLNKNTRNFELEGSKVRASVPNSINPTMSTMPVTVANGQVYMVLEDEEGNVIEHGYADEHGNIVDAQGNIKLKNLSTSKKGEGTVYSINRNRMNEKLKVITANMSVKIPLVNVTPEFVRSVIKTAKDAPEREITGVSKKVLRFKVNKNNKYNLDLQQTVEVNQIIRNRKDGTKEEKEQLISNVRTESKKVEKRIEKKISSIEKLHTATGLPNTKTRAERKAVKEEMLKNSVAGIRDKKDLIEAIKVSLEQVDRNVVEKSIKEYMAVNKKEKLEVSDISKIQKVLNSNLKASGKTIEVADSFSKNIRESIKHTESGTRDKLKEKFIDAKSTPKIEVNDVVSSIKQLNKSKQIDKIVIDTVVREVKNDRKIKQAITKQDKESLKKLVNETLNDKIKNSELTEELKEKFERALEEKISNKKEEKEVVDDKLSKMTTEQVTDLLYNMVNIEENVNRKLNNNKYASISEDIRTLQAYNNLNKEVTGNNIYEDISGIILNMRKKES